MSSDLFAPDSAAEGVPQPGRIWMEPRVFTALGIAPGEQVLLGEISLVAEKVLASLPGRGGDLFGVAPVVLVNEKDLNATGLIGPGSRIQVSLLLAGKDSDLQNYKSEVSPSLEAGASFQDIREARPEIRVALERAGMFLGLAALTSVILAGVAVAMAARRFAIRHLDHAAIMRCLGATQSFITRVFGFQLLFLGLAASLVGSALGFAAHFLLLEIVTGLLGVVLPAADYKPLLAAILTGSITLIGFALPPILHLKRVPALRVLRRDIGNISTPGRLAYLFGVAALSGLVLWQADDIKLGVYVVLGFLIAIALLALCAWCLLALIRKLRLRGGGWRFGLLHLVRHGRATMIQTVAFGLGIMSLLLLAVIRGDLLDEWQGSLPADAPNRFIVNVQPNQVAPMQEFFTQANVKPPELFPIVRARMVEINGVPVEKQLDDEQVRRQVDRPLNVSWVETLMSDNQILEGKWWDEIEDPSMNLVSIEEGVAKNLKLKLGDMLKFNVAGEHFEVKVASIRKVDWDSFRANFFVLARPGFLNEYPTTYMTGFYLGTENYKLLGDLVKQFPSITVLDVAAIMGHVRDII
ncbi:MAG: ABC transporter permease, partial [Gammaproteobacteria bacterium]|nr:ABC transporter permease [Gammaproteobacteria bacterium]